MNGLVVLSRSFFDESADHHPQLFQIGELSDEQIVHYVSQFLEEDDRAAFVACRSGRIVGYVTAIVQTRPAYWSVRSVGHVSGLMVDRAYRRRGIGSQLLAQAEADFGERGARYYTLYTAVANEDALAFYRNRGMEPLYVHLVGEVGQSS